MYDWVKVVHVLAVISWMAGLLYLPRLMVYHTDSSVGSEQDIVFRTMEGRLLRAIMRPAAVAAVLTGLALIHLTGFGLGDVWLVIKLAAVVCMVVVHGLLEGHVRDFRVGVRRRSGTYFRVLNEVPAALMVVIVIMVLIKPFS